MANPDVGYERNNVVETKWGQYLNHNVLTSIRNHVFSIKLHEGIVVNVSPGNRVKIMFDDKRTLWFEPEEIVLVEDLGLVVVRQAKEAMEDGKQQRTDN